MPQETARRALSSEWFERLVRIGHAAKALVFGGIGFIAARIALGDEDETPDFIGALDALSDRPLDVLFLVVLAIGLFCYAAWRFAYAIAAPEGSGKGIREWFTRLTFAGVGFTYAGFGIYAIALLAGMQRGDENISDETATVMSWPYGEWLVGAVALGFGLAGLYELFIAFTGRFKDEFGNVKLGRIERWFILFVGWWGHAARGTIYVVAGFFGVKSAVQYDPDEARGFAETLWELGSGPAGRWILLFIALGLAAFGLYSLMLALRRHIPDPETGKPEERMP